MNTDTIPLTLMPIDLFRINTFVSYFSVAIEYKKCNFTNIKPKLQVSNISVSYFL